MTTKEWMMRGWRIDLEITALERTRQETWDRLTSTTPSYVGKLVKGENDPHKFERLTELDADIDRRIDRLIDTKREIIDVIAQVPDSRYRTLLTERYTAFKTWEQIAVDMNYSFRQVTRMHGLALMALTPIIERRMS